MGYYYDKSGRQVHVEEEGDSKRGRGSDGSTVIIVLGLAIIYGIYKAVVSALIAVDLYLTKWAQHPLPYKIIAGYYQGIRISLSYLSDKILSLITIIEKEKFTSYANLDSIIKLGIALISAAVVGAIFIFLYRKLRDWPRKRMLGIILLILLLGPMFAGLLYYSGENAIVWLFKK